MTTIKKLFLFPSLFFISSFGYCQLGDMLKGKVQNRVQNEENTQMDKGLDKTENGIKNSLKKKKKNGADSTSTQSSDNSSQTNSNSSGAQSNSGSSQSPQANFKSYSKFDFVPGEKVVFFDDFSNGAIGDFPVNWNTGGSGELVTLSNMPGKWLKWSAGVSYAPQLKESFPENFTLEFDLLLQKPEGKEDPYFALTIYSSDKDILNEETFGCGSTGVGFQTQSSWDVSSWSNGESQNAGSSNQVTNSSLYDNKTHISVWGQKQRFRVYVNETKVLDLPMAIPAGAKLNKLKFCNNPGLNLTNDMAGPIFLTNVRIAVGAPDMRSKLITDGKLVTRGITFDSGSDKIKPESYGTLKEIAKVLAENAGVKVKIVGHTDSDGADAANLELSKKRAVAIKNSLSKDFAIDNSRMETDGMGESVPVSPNTTPEGKANNRRVEFLKM